MAPPWRNWPAGHAHHPGGGPGLAERIESGVAGLDLLAQGRLDFEAPDLEAFPCLRLARQAMEAGGAAPAVLNAANEIAVSAFLQGQVGFLAIPALVEEALAALPGCRLTRWKLCWRRMRNPAGSPNRTCHDTDRMPDFRLHRNQRCSGGCRP